MNNKLILDLTVRLTQALDQNYDVVNMDTVLAVISALEGTTITKEQLETTRLAKHINQLRRRNKSNILALRAKNLLKKWREMVGITSQAQSEGTPSSTQQAQPTQQQVPKPILSSASQPASPYTSQLLGENFDNSLSSIGGGLEFISRTATGGVSNTGSANFNLSKKSTTGPGAGERGVTISSRSNGALSDSQVRLIKNSNRSIKNNSSPGLSATITKVKHPTSFKNLITAFNINSAAKQTNPSALSPKMKVPLGSSSGGGEREEPNLKTNSTPYIIDDDDNQSRPSTTGVAQTGVLSPRTHKSTKRKERDSLEVITFIEHSNSPIGFDNVTHEQGRGSQITRNNNVMQIVTSIIDLHDSNSSSNFVNALSEAADINAGNSEHVAISTSNSNKRLRKEKKRSNEKVNLVTESEHFQPTIDDSSRIAFPISGIQEYLSLSNTSTSIFPSQQTAGSGGLERYPTNAGSNDENQPLNTTATERNSEALDGDLTFAGKFKQSNNSNNIEVGSSSNYFSNGGENTSVTSSEFPCGNMKVAINNCRDSVNIGGTASTSTFLPFGRNSNDSTSNSRTSQLELIDVVNQDSQSMITVDDLRQQQHSSNEKNKAQRDVDIGLDNQQAKCLKENFNTSKQYSKEQTKSATAQRPLNTSSKPSTPTSTQNFFLTNAVTTLSIEQKVPKKRGRKKGSKGVDSVLAQSGGLSSQFLMGPALGSNKKVKTTMELLADIQNRKLGSATSSPTLMNWFGTSRPASSCSEPSLHSPRTSDACSTNATMSTAARSTPEKNMSNNSVAADELYESDSDSNDSEPSHDSVKMSITNALTKLKPIAGESCAVTGMKSVPMSTIEEQIKELMALLPPVNPEKIDWEAYEDIPCTCTLREIPAEIEVNLDSSEEINENCLNLAKGVDGIKDKNNDDRQDEEGPIISVNILPLPSQKPAHLWAARAPHSQSAPVSAVTSPVVPSSNQKPIKSIFDLDFDDDNDPLHSFVEAASRTKPPTKSLSTTESVKSAHEEKPIKPANQNNDYSDIVKEEQSQTQITPQQPPIQAIQQQRSPLQLGISDPVAAPYVNFPTYDVIEDSNCQAKLRYEIQTNQITKFHINAFHNCFIPNVNGNWDHSMPQNIDDESDHLENDSLYANVVPKYGCFITERIPKDLTHVNFTKDFKPKKNKKSDKPPQPFLGVANIHRRQHFRLHHHQRLKKKTAIKKKKHSKIVNFKAEDDQETKYGNNKKKILNNTEPLDGSASSNPFEPNIVAPNNIKVNNEVKVASEIKESSPTNVPEINPTSTKLNNCNDDLSLPNNNNSKNITIPSVSDKGESNFGKNSGTVDELSKDLKLSSTDTKKPIANGNIHHLMNNNSIVHCSDESKNCISGNTKQVHNNNHNLHIGLVDEDVIAASRRSSSCSNSSLKQNQNSINMKLRRHRLEQQQLQKQRQRRKRKHLSSFTDVFEFDTDETTEQPKVPPLVKRIKIVNGECLPGRRLTNSITDSSCLDDDGDSDCYHIHSENDIITEEEIEEDGDDPVIREGDDEDDEEIADDYDEDGDDEEDIEEDYGDFHEVVTRDMTSSTTGNNHIVLTIKKTPSKTNSPSSSSMSPAPAPSVNVKLPSNSPTIQSTVDALLLEDNTIELTTDQTELGFQGDNKIELEKLLQLSTVKTVDLIDKTDFFLPETSHVAIYSFQVKKNGDNDHENDDEDNNERQEENTIPDRTEGRTDENDNTEKKETMEKNETAVADRKDFKEITKAELSESIQLTKKHLRRLELKTRLRQGIEEAQKLHRQLFFPYELQTSLGSKILEINSCTSDCTDPSDDETDISDDDSTTSASTSDVNEKSSLLLKKRRKRKLPTKKQKAAGGGGGPPSSSSSSSSSDSSSSSSESAFTSWTTSSSSDEEDNKPQSSIVKKEEQSSSSDNKDKEEEKDLPTENNYLLRSFNHIYVSTEERRRQEQLKQAEYQAEYRRRNIVNSGYITLSGDNSNEESPSTSAAPLVPNDNSNVYINFYNNSLMNIYSASSTTGITWKNNTATNMEIPAIGPSTSGIEQSVIQPSEVESPKIKSSATENSIKEEETSIEGLSIAEPSTMAKPETLDSSAVEPLSGDTTNNNNDNNYRINQERSIGNNNNSNVQLVENTDEQNLVAQEEYRTGLRKVDEDVDDEDGNNCARTQQFKEWHEVLQLRSYNDELLTVLPYVVIE